jgi:hypothetical protein
MDEMLDLVRPNAPHQPHRATVKHPLGLNLPPGVG